YIENHSTVPIVVFAITLTNCQNVKVQCGARNMKLRVDGGSRSLAVRVEPQSLQMPWNYSFGFSWHADTSYGTAALSALAQGTVLGMTRWVRWHIVSDAVQFLPPETLGAKRPGRTTIHFSLAEEPQKMLPAPIADIDYPVIAAYPVDPHAPVFEGRAVDADS